MRPKKLATPFIIMLLGACTASVSTSPCSCISQADLADGIFGITSYEGTPSEIELIIKKKFQLGSPKEEIDKEVLPYSNGLCKDIKPNSTICSFIFSTGSFSDKIISIKLNYGEQSTLVSVEVEKT